MKTKIKTQERTVGDIVRINLGDEFHTYARVLEEALFAFYDCRVREVVPVEQIISSPILFQIPVMNYAVKRGIWMVVGNVPLDNVLINPPPRFIQDALKKDVYKIYSKGKAYPATREECIGLEREAVWDPAHVEDRLKDHYAGRKNKWVESLKIKE